MVVLCHWGQINYKLAKLAALALAFGWNFPSRQFWLFWGRPAAEPA
jgi:hypothetical protein